MNKLIITYLLITVIPVSFIGYIGYNQYTKSIEEQVGEYIPRVLDQANERINDHINELKELPDFLYNSDQVIEILRKDAYQNNSSLLQDKFLVNSYLTNTYINGGNSDILGVFILSKNRLFAASRLPYTGFEEIALPFGQDFDLKGKQQIIFPNQIKLKFKNNPPYILLLQQITDTENRMKLGTIFIAVDLTFVKNIVKNLETVNKADITLMDTNGQIIYDTTPKYIGRTNMDLKHYPKINGSFKTIREKDNKLISISRIGPDQWILTHSVLLKNLTERTDLVRKATIIAFLGVILISTVISIILAWSVSRPINRLTKLMKQVEKGNFNVDLPISGNDEVGVLAKSFNSMVHEINSLIKQNFQIKLQQKEAELYALQSQINPHFMYNTLETVGMAVEEGEDEVVVEMVTRLGRMLRFSINNKEKMVTIDQEVQHIKDYLTIQKFRFEDRIEFSIQEDIDSKKYYTPKFILQPIVENAIKHGLDEEQDFKIDIFITRVGNVSTKNEEVIFRVIDNGPGIPEKTISDLKSYLESDPMARRDSQFGLINVHGRLIMMFGKGYGLQINSQMKKGTEVIISIPLVMQDNLGKVEGGGGSEQ
ncbi:cache domain-containing sensor histidine kinase [Neobacillus cucumis]|uniref:cache domain-containing sensor histidine kinase n=1 Tax=Neobacillus cucumis TaxID=1740721 RepID=UPI0028533BE9|nr:sensor histidine kinase [Neobacillus cucumis]MDR4947939.1 sensor histidine kinase [Neobacillus cucumis]